MGDSEVSSMCQWKRLPSQPDPDQPVRSCVPRRCLRPGFVPRWLAPFSALSAAPCSEPALLPHTPPSSPRLVLRSHLGLEKGEEQSLNSKPFLGISVRGAVAASPAAQVNGNIFISSSFPFPRVVRAEGVAWFRPTASGEKDSVDLWLVVVRDLEQHIK